MPSDHSPGFRFKEGKLYIFTEAGVMVLESWPVLRAVRKSDDQLWEEFAPAFRLVQPYRPKKVKPSPQLELDLGAAAAPRPENSIAAQRKRAFDSFRFWLPKPAAARAEKYQSRQWALLRLFHARKETLEFAEQKAARFLGSFPSPSDGLHITLAALLGKVWAKSGNTTSGIYGRCFHLLLSQRQRIRPKAGRGAEKA